jgi:hypothetical protein
MAGGKGIEQWFIRYLTALWTDLLKKPIDERPTYKAPIQVFFKTELMKGLWASVYDMVDYTTRFLERDDLDQALNQVLERDLSAYRIINHQVSPITNDMEIASIEDALKQTEAFPGVHIHLENALSKLSDRKNPDHRTSIKESISTVEGICKIIANDNRGTLGGALEKVAQKTDLHPALKQGFEKLYGYTSDANGIRHALLDAPDLFFEDALYFLVSCSGFVHYLIQKCQRIGIPLEAHEK